MLYRGYGERELILAENLHSAKPTEIWSNA